MGVKTFLIVDDQKEVIRAIAQEIRQKLPGFRIINAGNGAKGVEVAVKEHPDLILMDWEMPEMNGIEAIRALKNNPDTHDIPVVMATGQMTSSEDLQVALDAGAVDYVRKPIDFIELTARINTALRIADQHKSIQQLLQSEIDLKNRKLSTTSMLIVEKNGLMQEFQNGLEELHHMIPDEAPDARKQLKTLRRRISHHLELDDSWETFKVHFDEVNPTFFDNLQKMSPDISHKDVKLCAYVKLGMDNKQIAQLLNISHASARTALFRLKKKLGLEQEDSLMAVLAEL